MFGVVGWKNNGKTTLVERLVAHLTALGYRVSTVKHAHHEVELDQPGKDTWRHREAGAEEVVLATARRWAVLHELRGAPEPTLDALLARMTPVDLVIVEGFKRFPHPKLEVHRRERGTPLLADEDGTIVAGGTSADRQLAIYRAALAGGAADAQAQAAVVDWLREATLNGIPVSV